MPSVAQVEFIVSGILREYTSLWGFGLGGLVSEAGAERLAGYIGNHKDFTISNGCHRGASEHAVYIYGAHLWGFAPNPTTPFKRRGNIPLGNVLILKPIKPGLPYCLLQQHKGAFL